MAILKEKEGIHFSIKYTNSPFILDNINQYNF